MRKVCILSGMELSYAPLLALYAKIYSLPRDMNRFNTYLASLANADRSDLAIAPLGPMNPMARQDVLDAIHALMALGADEIAARVTRALAPEVARVAQGARPLQIGDRRSVPVPAALKAGIAVMDATGGWTNRFANDFGLRAGSAAIAERGWVTITLWAQDAPDAHAVEVATALALHRLCHVLRHGNARTLADWLAQEGDAQRRAGAAQPLDADDLAYTAEVLAPLRGSDSHQTIIAALYGDPAARALGYPPLGLSANAGLGLALKEA